MAKYRAERMEQLKLVCDLLNQTQTFTSLSLAPTFRKASTPPSNLVCPPLVIPSYPFVINATRHQRHAPSALLNYPLLRNQAATFPLFGEIKEVLSLLKTFPTPWVPLAPCPPYRSSSPPNTLSSPKSYHSFSISNHCSPLLKGCHEHLHWRSGQMVTMINPTSLI